MSRHVTCPACRKQNLVEDSPTSQTVLCLACGARLAVEPVAYASADDMAATEAAAPEEELPDAGDENAELAEALRQSSSAGGRTQARRARKVARPGSGKALWVAGIVALLMIGVAGVVYTISSSRGGGGEASDIRDLLALKSEAEALAVSGKLEQAHGKYRELQEKSLGRTIKDPLFWDVIERAKVDQDRIYTLLLDRVESANPPEEAMATPGPGKSIRPDDPWYWPRVGTGGRAEPTTAEAGAPAEEAATPVAEGPAPAAGPDASAAVPDVAPPDTAAAGPNEIAAAPEPAVPEAGDPPSEPAAESPTTATAPQVAAADPAAPDGPAPTTNPAAAARTPPRWVSPDMVTDDQIGVALTRGGEYLLSQFKDGQLIPIPEMTHTQFAGRNAMAVYALLKAGQAMDDPRLDPKGEAMGRMIDVMKGHRLDRVGNQPSQPVTYARSVRAAALAIYNRPQDRDALKDDAQWLIAAAVNGAYTYDDSFSGQPLRDVRFKVVRPEVTEVAWDEPLTPESRLDAPAPWDDPSLWDAPGVADESLDWSDARRVFCDGLHDRYGREIGKIRRPRINRVGSPKSKLLPRQDRTPAPNLKRPQNRTTPPGMGPPQNRVPGTTTWVPPREVQRTPRPDLGAGPAEFPWDNSNSQYGLLGVWAAAETGVEVPVKYWEAVQKHWETWQFKTGEWGYMATDREGSLAMTCGGVASLLVTYDWLVAPKTRGSVGRPTMSDNLGAGFKWLETADNAVNTPVPGKTHYPGYDLFGLERVGLASGYKYFGSHDWYRELAAKSLASQFPSGAWGRDDGHPDGLIETSFHLLFLSHGRHPIFMNKLRFDRSRGERIGGKPLPGYWANRPRDAANLTRFASRELERSFNWQVVDLNREWHDWLDCPVLYIASHTPPALNDADYDKLRQFVEAGGIILTHADAGSPSFTKWVLEELAAKALPGRKVEPLKDDHLIYSLHYDLKKPLPALFGISNGSRLMLLHSPTDLGAAWQQRADRTQSTLYRLGMHVFLYAAGKNDFRNRIDSPYVPPAPDSTGGTVAVARLKYDGNWDPEPGAWRRFANLYQWEMQTNVPVSPTEFAGLDAAKTPVAHLTGNEAVAFTDEQVAALRTYVEVGGIVLVDPCGGSPLFDTSVRDGLIKKAFPGSAPQPLSPKHPILTGGEDDAEPIELKLRAYATDILKMKVPPLEIVTAGKGAVVLSRVDLTTGLLGTNTYTIVGYDAPFAQAIAWNLLLWAGDPERNTAAAN